MFYPRPNGGCDESTVELELVARSRPSSSHFTLPLGESGSSLSSLSGVWADRAGVLGTAPRQDDVGQTIIAARRSSTPTPPIEHPRTPHPLSSEGYKGQPLLGKWANASVGVSGAAVLKRSLTQPPNSPAFISQRSVHTYFPSPSSSRSSSRSGTPIPTDGSTDSIDGKSRRGSGGKEWTPVRNDRRGSGGERERREKGRGRDDQRSSGYNRSVSDTHEFRRGGKQQRGGHKQSFSSSEPINSQHDHRKRN